MNPWVSLLTTTCGMLLAAVPPSLSAQESRNQPLGVPAAAIEWNGRHYNPSQYKRIAKEMPRSAMLSMPERAKATPVTFVAAIADDQKLGVNDLILQQIQPAKAHQELTALTVDILEGKNPKPVGRAILVGATKVLDFFPPDAIRVTGLFVGNYRGLDQAEMPVVEAQLTEMLTPPAVRLAYDVRHDVRGVVITGQVTNAGSRAFSFVRIAAEPVTLASYYSSDSVGDLKPGATKSFRISLIGSGVPRTTDVHRHFRVYVEDYRFARLRSGKSKAASKPTAARP